MSIWRVAVCHWSLSFQSACVPPHYKPCHASSIWLTRVVLQNVHVAYGLGANALSPNPSPFTSPTQAFPPTCSNVAVWCPNVVPLISVIKARHCVLTALHSQVGAHIHTVTKEEYTKVGSEALLQQLADQLRSQGKKPYCIPVGGSSPLGCWGYLEAVREIQEQAGDLGITDIALVCMSSVMTHHPKALACLVVYCTDCKLKHV